MNNKKGISEFGIGVFVIFLVLVVMFLFSSFTIIDAGERGVVISATTGVKDEVLGEGFHFKTPFVDRVKEINVQTTKIEKETVSTSADQQIVNVKIALNYHPTPDSVNKLYQQIGMDYESRIILPAMEDGIKTAMAQFKAEDLIQRRDEVGAKALDIIKSKIEKKYISVDGFNIIEIDFSETYNNAIELKVEAEQNVEKEKNILEKEKIQAEILIVQSEAQKQRAILEAQGRAESTKIEAEAQANAIQKINDAMSQNENYLTYQYISTWNGQMPMIVSDGSGFIVDLQNKVSTDMN